MRRCGGTLWARFDWEDPNFKKGKKKKVPGPPLLKRGRKVLRNNRQNPFNETKMQNGRKFQPRYSLK